MRVAQHSQVPRVRFIEQATTASIWLTVRQPPASASTIRKQSGWAERLQPVGCPGVRLRDLGLVPRVDRQRPAMGGQFQQKIDELVARSKGADPADIAHEKQPTDPIDTETRILSDPMAALSSRGRDGPLMAL